MSNLSLGLGLVPSFLGRLLSGFSLASLFAASEQGVWYDPSDKANLDWRRNLLRDTASFQTSNWVALGSSISVNAAAAPDGTMTADKVVEDTSTGAHRSLASGDNAVSVNSGQTVAFSIYVKTAGRTHVYIRVNNAGGDIVTGTVRLSDATVTQTIDGVVTAQTAGDGWVRVVGSGVSAVTASTFAEIRCGNSDAYAGYTGDGTSGIFLWGAQLELGSTATDYQKITDVFTETRERFPNATLYQDSAGAQPAASAGDVVGLMLDKSQGLVRGPELVTNGGFDDAAGWTLGTGWTISGGVASFNNPSGSSLSRSLSSTLTAGRGYEVSLSVTAVSTVGVQVGFNGGGGSDNGPIISSGGSFTFVIFTTLNRTGIFVSGIGGNSYTIDNISVKEIPGNHATQSTTASKPILARHPVGGRRNLLTYTEDFGDAVWTKANVAIALNATAAPDGSLTADTLTENTSAGYHFVERNISTAVNQTYVASGFFKYIDRQYVSLSVFDNAGSSLYASATFDIQTGTVASTSSAGAGYAVNSATIESAGDGWYRCVVRMTNGSTSTATRVGYALSNAAATGSFGLNTYTGSSKGAHIWGAQLETGTTATAYQRVGSQYNVTEAGKSDLWYLAFDGFDDSMATGSIDFTSTDEMTVIAGVRKLSDAAVTCLVELSNNSSGNSGSWGVFAPRTSGRADYGVHLRGTTQNERQTPASFAAPSTDVNTALLKISGAPEMVGRIDGAEQVMSVQAASGDAGTGNFGTYPLYIGRRGGTSLPYNGHLYGLVVRGALTAGDTLTKSEEAVSQKTYGDAVFGVPPAEGGISYVGGASAGFDGSTSPNNSLSLTSLSGGSDTAPAAGDVIVVMYASGTQGDIDLSATGYTEIVELWADDSRDANLSAFYKIAGAGETAVSLSPTGSTSYGAVAIAKVFRGVDNVTPLDVTTATATGLDNIYADPPAITPITDGAMIVAAGAAGVSAGAAAFSSSDLDSFLSLAHDEGVDVVLGVGQKAWTGGAFNPATFTDGGTDSTANSWAAITLALRPA